MFGSRVDAEIEETGGRAYLRGDIVHWLEKHGLYKAYGDNSGVSSTEIFPTIVAMHQIWHDDSATFVCKLADIVLPVGDWVVYGAHKTVGEILGDYRDDHYDEIFTAAMRFCPARKIGFTPAETSLLHKIRSNQ